MIELRLCSRLYTGVLLFSPISSEVFCRKFADTFKNDGTEIMICFDLTEAFINRENAHVKHLRATKRSPEIPCTFKTKLDKLDKLEMMALQMFYQPRERIRKTPVDSEYVSEKTIDTFKSMVHDKRVFRFYGGLYR